MSQGAFIFYTNQSPEITDTSSNWSYLGGTPYAGPPIDWTQVVIGYSGTEPGNNETQTYSSNWTISGTGGSGKIYQIQFITGSGSGRSVRVTLDIGGGTLDQPTDQNNRAYTFNPPQPQCFVTGTRILTQNGYKAIETLLATDVLVLSDGRLMLGYDMKKLVVESATVKTAPYRIKAGAFGRNKPNQEICLSPRHMIQIRKNVWISPVHAAKKNQNVQQYGIGEPVTYWHIANANYLTDNLVCEGMVVESLATNNNYHGPAKIYTWNNRLDGFTRISTAYNFREKREKNRH